MIQYKTDRIRDEFPRIHPKLQHLLHWLDLWSVQRTGYDAVITTLIRTPAEHQAIYPGQVPPPLTPHIDGRGADLRSSNYTPEQIDLMVADCNAAFPRTDGKPTLLFHKISTSVFHLHAQVPADEWRLSPA